MNINDSEGQFQSAPLLLPDQLNFMVLVGGNNSGKSTFLREVVKTDGDGAYRVDVNRTVLKGEGAQAQDYQKHIKNLVSNSRNANDDNYEKGNQTLQDFFLLNDAERNPITNWYNEYFPTRLYEERENPLNSASPMLLKANGFSITKQGSGMRSTIEIFVRLFDPTIKVLCIDEPELGLEPYLQKYLFQAIKDKASPQKKIIIATHSHHFLDFEELTNNYICKRDDANKIFLEPVTNMEQVVFRLLGNTLSSYLLPEQILVLEGPSDTTFLTKSLELTGKSNYAIHNSRGISNVTYAMNAITQFIRFNGNLLPVYHEKIFVLVDNPSDIKDIVVREWMRIVPYPDRQICKLKENGIEYYYPERILQQVFKTPERKKTIIDAYIAAKPNSFNGIKLSKNELSKVVANNLTVDDFKDSENQLFGFINTLP